jgi:hypothetical protein
MRISFSMPYDAPSLLPPNVRICRWSKRPWEAAFSEQLGDDVLELNDCFFGPLYYRKKNGREPERAQTALFLNSQSQRCGLLELSHPFFE